MSDMINHPPHYTSHPSGVECLTITRHMGFNLGNAFKYLWRADLKGAAIDDLRKAIFYIQDEIAKREAANKTPTEGLTFAQHMARPEIAARHAIDTEPQVLDWPVIAAPEKPVQRDDLSALPTAGKTQEGHQAGRKSGSA